MFIDSHAHLFEPKIDLSKLDLSRVDKVLVPTYKMEQFEFVKQFCRKNDKFFLSVGVHPEFICSFDEKKFLDFVSTNQKEIVAIGEIGLDSGYPDYEKQKQVLLSQLKIAKKYASPISVHLRGNVFDDFWRLFDGFSLKCALHCFSGNETDLTKALDRDCFISFAANITYKGNVHLRNLAKLVPDDKLLIETDSPSMAPSGFPRGSVNTSENIIYVADCLAKVRNTDLSHIANITKANANKLFFKDKK